MSETVCPLCGSGEIKGLFKRKDRFKTNSDVFFVVQCLKCGLAFTYPSLPWAEMKKFYPAVYSWKKEHGAENSLAKILRKMEEWYVRHLLRYDTKRLMKFVSGRGKIIDIGCGTGSRLEVFKGMGFSDCFGIEPSEEAIYAKEARKLAVEHCGLGEFNCSDNSYDIATLYHVFEHLDKPTNQLKIVQRILKPGGYLVLQLPNFDSWQARIFNRNWFGFDVPRHYFHYSPKTISRLLKQNGFEVKKIDCWINWLHPIYWAISLFPSLDPQLAWAKEEKGRSNVINRFLWVLVTLLSILPAKIENVFGKSGNMTIYAVNKKG